MVQQLGQLSPDGLWRWNGTQWVPNAPLIAPSSGPAWARPYESARGRATLASIFLGATIVGLVIGIAFDFVQIAYGSTNLTDTQTIVVGLVGLAFLLTYLGSQIPAIVFFCMWLHRAVRNMPALGAWDPRWSPAGAVGRCFIPFLNLVHPLFSTLDVWRGSAPSWRWINVSERRAMGSPAMIIVWWALWLLGNWVGAIGSRLSTSNDAGTAAAGNWINAFGFLLGIGAAILAVLVVREVTARQDRKNELMVSGQLS